MDKYLESDALSWIADCRSKGDKIVLTNGVFDILHIGHLRSLQYCRSLGDKLIVCVNSDSTVRELKGETRPIVPEQERAEMLLGFECVDKVVIFNEKRLGNLMKLLAPDVYGKGGDYTLDTIDKSERAALEGVGAKIHFYSIVADRSSTSLISKI